ncbi:phage integrase N-terminal domain-containing protein, partial [Rhizobium sp. CNPSo 4062]|uniref:phage integrase N-terminal domain-containing protein n=1 Tax=Rhizobium sp. CNPSo 4062 TaxID=3021410 RepID=UPI002551A50B
MGKKVKVPPGVRNQGTYQNLMQQVTKVSKHVNQGSIKTRERYKEAVDRFARHLADQYNVQRFANVNDKHLQSYIQ